MKSRLPLVIGVFFFCLFLATNFSAQAQDLSDPSELAPTDKEPTASFILTYDPEVPILLGEGYNSVSQNAGGEDCIFDATTTPVVGPCVEHTYFNYVNSTEELAQTLNLNLGASMNTGMYSGSISGSAFSRHQVSESTLTAVAMMEIKCGAAVIAEPRLSEGITGQNYFGVCGDYYADSVTVGGKLYAVLSIQTSSQDDQKQIKADLNVSVKGQGSGHVSFSDDMASKLDKYNADTDVYTVGCKVYDPVTNFQGFLDLLKTFKDDTQACINNNYSGTAASGAVSAADAMKLASDVRFISITPALKRKYSNVEEVTSQRDAMYTMLAWRAAYKALEVDIDTIRARPDLYQIPQDQLDAELRSLATLRENIQQTYLPTVETRINHCTIYPDTCTLLTDAELAKGDRPVSIWNSLPQPKDFYPQDCNEVQRIFGSPQDDSDYVIYLNGDSQKGYLARCRFGNSTGDAKTYLSLARTSSMQSGQDPVHNAGLTYNYSSFINYYISGDHTWPDLVTVWDKVRIVPQGSLVYIDRTDNTYATTFYYPSMENQAWPLGHSCHTQLNDIWFAPYGSAVGGNNGRRDLPGTTGHANIDLNGTPFALADDQSFTTYSGSNLQQVTYGAERRSVQIDVGGNNGYGNPAGANIYLKGVGSWVTQ
jgi:hypothetical protein